MSLINCPECNKQISDKADLCISCGYPVKAIKEQNIEESRLIKNKLIHTLKALKSCPQCNGLVSEKASTCSNCGGHVNKNLIGEFKKQDVQNLNDTSSNYQTGITIGGSLQNGNANAGPNIGCGCLSALSAYVLVFIGILVLIFGAALKSNITIITGIFILVVVVFLWINWNKSLDALIK